MEVVCSNEDEKKKKICTDQSLMDMIL